MKTCQKTMLSRQEEPSTLASWALGLVETLEQTGQTRQHVLAYAEIDAEVFQTPGARLSLKQFGKLWELAQNSFGARAGLEVGKNIKIAHWQTLGLGLASSMSSGDWLKRLTNYTGLITDGLSVRMEVRPDLSTVLTLAFTSNVSYTDLRMESILKAAFELIRNLFGIDMRALVSLELTRQQPDDPTPWHDAFGHQIAWSCPEVKVIARPEVQQIVIATTDPDLSQTHMALLQRALDKQKSKPLEQQVCEQISKGFRTGKTSLQHIASELGMSPRSLQRRLDAQGRGFSELRDSVRLEEAKVLLAQGFSGTDIAVKLGYSEVTNFHAAFKRWTGLTTSEFLDSVRKP